MDRFLFRADTNLDDNTDIICRADKSYFYKSLEELHSPDEIKEYTKKRLKEINNHIMLGSQGYNSNFISTTTRIALAHIYSTSFKKATEFRTPIALIDTAKLPPKTFASIINSTDPLDLKKYISNEKTKKYALASREVLIEDKIPKEAFVKIPEPLVDVLCAFESNAYISCEEQKSNYEYVSYQIMQNALCTAIVNNKNCLNSILDTVKFSPLEQTIFNTYYASDNNRKTINEISNTLGFKNLQIVNSIKTNIIKKICNSAGIKTIIKNNLNFGDPTLHPKDIEFIQNYLEAPSNTNKYFNYYLGSLINNEEDYSKTYYQQPIEMKNMPEYTLDSQKKVASLFYPNGGTLELHLAKKEGFSQKFPYGIEEIESKDNDFLQFKMLSLEVEYHSKTNNSPGLNQPSGFYFNKNKDNSFKILQTPTLKISKKLLKQLDKPKEKSLQELKEEKENLIKQLEKAKELKKEYENLLENKNKSR